MLTGVNVSCHLLHVNVHFTNQNIMQRRDSMELQNGVICLVIIFTPRVIVNEMSKIVHILYFLVIKCT